MMFSSKLIIVIAVAWLVVFLPAIGLIAGRAVGKEKEPKGPRGVGLPPGSAGPPHR